MTASVGMGRAMGGEGRLLLLVGLMPGVVHELVAPVVPPLPFHHLQFHQASPQNGDVGEE